MLCLWLMVLAAPAVSCYTLVFHYPDEEAFRRIVNQTYFVDKSLLIEHFLLSSDDRLMIAAPPKFGKTVNHMMLRDFFQAPINAEEVLLKKEESQFYDIFKQLNIGRSPVFEENFGSRGVLYLDFSAVTPFSNFAEFLIQFGFKFKNFLRIYHPYIFQPKINQTQQFDRKCGSGYMGSCPSQRADESTDVSPIKTHIYDCSVMLLRLFKSIYKVPSLILIDSASKPFDLALVKTNPRRIPSKQMKAENIESISDFLGNFLTNLIERHPDLVWRAYITGTLREAHNYGPKTLRYKSIFEDAQLMKFYGFTEEEVDEVIRNSGLKPIETRQLADFIGGYHAFDRSQNGDTIFCTGALVNYVTRGRDEWCKDDRISLFPALHIYFFSNLLASSGLGLEVIKSLQPKSEVREFPVHRLTTENLLTLRTAETSTSNMTMKIAGPLFFYYWLENGLFTAKKVGDEYVLSVPNRMAFHEIKRAVPMMEVIKNDIGCSGHSIRNLCKSISQLDGGQASLKYVTESIAKIFMKKSLAKLNVDLAAVLYAFSIGTYAMAGDLYIPVSPPNERRKLSYVDLYLTRPDETIIFFNTRNDPSGNSLSSSEKDLNFFVQPDYTMAIERSTYKQIETCILIDVHLNETSCSCSMLYATCCLRCKTFKVVKPSLHYTVSLDDIAMRRKQMQAKHAKKINE